MKLKKINKAKKGQISVFDFFIAFFIFSILLVISMTSWHNYNVKIEERTEYNYMISKAFQISDTLVKSKGTPENWTSSNVKIIGLAADDRNISSAKLNLFANLSVTKSESIFRAYRYNFSFTLRNLNNSIIKEYGSNSTNAKKAANARRYVLYNNNPAIIDFTLWR